MVLKIFTFLSCFFGHVENCVVREIRLIKKFMMSQSGKQTIATHIFPNISGCKGSKKMKFGQLKMWWGNYSQTLL